MGHRSKVIIYAMGNLEYISSALLEEIASSGFVLIHAPCGGNDFKNLLREWSQLNPSSPATTVMLISRNYTMVDPYLFRLLDSLLFVYIQKMAGLLPLTSQ
uniref:NYN domain-containing protein n=1 Tax=Brassica campestris TaxID=3711 RepID=M4F7F5_BRACM